MDGKYTFVSYAHKDKRFVKKEIRRREKLGQVFWYDKDIKAGSDWAESIADNLSNAASILYFESPSSKRSENCKRELAYAKEHNIPIETVNLGGAAGTIVGAIVLLAAIYLALYLSVFVTIPNVIGFKTADAENKLAEYGFKSSVSYDYSDEFPLGLIMKQSLKGKTFSFLPINITQSLGPDTRLITVPDTVGSYISDGVKMLADAGLTKFSITAENLKENSFGTITSQSAPAGYKVSSECNVELFVATNENPVSFEYNGLIITLPAEEGDSVVIDIEESTVEYVEGYKERDLNNARFIYVERGDLVLVENESFDVPVVVSGESDAQIAFLNCIFNDDLILKTENEAVMVGVESTCTLKGKLCIINDIMQSDIQTNLPKFVIESTMPVVVEHGSGTCFMLEKEDFFFNGEKLSFSEATMYIDSSGKEDTLVELEGSGKEPIMYFASQLQNKGKQETFVCTSNIDLFPERAGNKK